MESQVFNIEIYLLYSIIMAKKSMVKILGLMITMKLPFGMIMMKLTKEGGRLDTLKMLGYPWFSCILKVSNLVQVRCNFGHILEQIINGFKHQNMKSKYQN